MTTEKIHHSSEFVKREILSNQPKIKDEFTKDCNGLNCSDINKSFHNENDRQHFYTTPSNTVVPKTILITNNYSQDDHSGSNSHQNIQKSSSITIVTHNGDGEHSTSNIPTSANSSTVVLDRINICINNHFNDPRSISNKSTLIKTEKVLTDNSLKEKVPLEEPDSTTSNISTRSETTMSPKEQSPPIPSYSTGEDVLVQRKDGRFYLGTLIAIARNQCLVKLDDGSECWSLFSEITKLSSTDTNDAPMCVVCKKVNDNEVVEVCEKCGRGYHQNCAEGRFQKNGVWYCRRCAARNGFKIKQFKSRIGSVEGVLSDKSQLPYDIDSLTWDNHHRVNMEQIYCYCGGNGEWHNRMLQCCKCQQWFHEKCVRCLDYPIYRGDRFFVFACSMCNKGSEFLRRLVMKWTDVIHLLLFNLTTYNQQKYYHAEKVIVPYAIDNWPFLHLPIQMQSLSAKEIKENVLSTLLTHSAKFKCGREIKKKQSVFGLRTRIPPPAPVITIPPNVEIEEQYLKQGLQLNLISIESIIDLPKDVEIKMSGIEYLGENSDNESTGGGSDAKFTSDDELPLKLSIEKEKQREEQLAAARRLLQKEISKKSMEIHRDTSSSVLIDEEDSLGNDRVSFLTDSSDKSRDGGDFTVPDDDVDVEMKAEETIGDIVTRIKRNRKRKSPFISSLDCVENVTKKHTDKIDICDSSDETSSRGTLDLIIPPPKNFKGRNNPFRLTPKKVDNASSNVLVAQKISGVSSSSTSENSVTEKTGNQSIVNSKIFGQVDLSQVANQFRIVRTVKRRLSAKDITIGPNKEIKRRRLRRRSGNVEVISTTTIQTLPKSAVYLPMRSDSKDLPISAIRTTLASAYTSSSSSPQTTSPTNLGSISNVFNGRRLRQRQERNYAETPRRSSQTGLVAPGASAASVPSSPNKSGQHESDVSLSDLKSSVNMYFGAVNRIASGENFVVRAKRNAPNGRVQYLIEWEGIS